ncbi:MAG: hypothetical protein WD738_10440 [Pirellulales bacterium]
MEVALDTEPGAADFAHDRLTIVGCLISATSSPSKLRRQQPHVSQGYADEPSARLKKKISHGTGDVREARVLAVVLVFAEAFTIGQLPLEAAMHRLRTNNLDQSWFGVYSRILVAVRTTVNKKPPGRAFAQMHCAKIRLESSRIVAENELMLHRSRRGTQP